MSLKLPPAPLYSASIHFATKEMRNEETSTVIIFREAGGFKGAKAAVCRWWFARNRVVPDYFDRLFAIKIYAYEAHEIDALGNLPPSIGMASVEWKCDHSPLTMWLAQ